MLVVCSDTHGTDGARLSGRTREAVADAERVIHAGDFTSEAALEEFYEVAARLDAVHGNADDPAVRDRLPEARVLTYEGVRFAVTHRVEGGPTGLAMFGREKGADVVVSGHTHRPQVREGTPTLLNPGSHADPRGSAPAHAELLPVEGGLDGRIYRRDGTVIEHFEIRT